MQSLKEQIAAAPESMIGRKNIYTCEKCGAHIVTEDIAEGVTPFLIGCTVPVCDGTMQSSMYRVFDQRMRASHQWYRPTVVEVLTEGERDHVERGGLLLRKTDFGQRMFEAALGLPK